MKVSKKLLYIVNNPISIIVTFLVFCILGSTLGTIRSGIFIYDTWPALVTRIKSSVTILPWSLWSLVSILPEILEEAVRDFDYLAWLFLIPFAFAITYREATGSHKGLEKERKAWMEWYETQQNTIESGDEFELPSSVENINRESYLKIVQDTLLFIVRNPLLLILHFAIWVYIFAMLKFLFTVNEGIVEASSNFVNSLSKDILLAFVSSLISCYRDARGNLKGIAAERLVWSKWYQRQNEINKHGDTIGAPPPSKDIRGDSYMTTIIPTILTILRRPTTFLTQFIFWFVTCELLYSLSLGFWYKPRAFNVYSILLEYAISAGILAFLISYRKARAEQRGFAIENQAWMRWIKLQKEKSTEYVLGNPPNSENIMNDTYFITVKKALISLLHKPQRILLHFICWIITIMLLYGFTNWLLFERLNNIVQMLLIVTLTLISSYQVTIGNINGSKKQWKVWTDWYNGQPDDRVDDIQSSLPPPMLKVW